MTKGTVPATALIALLLGLLLFGGAAPAASDIERQRQLFQDVFEEVELGNWDVVDDLANEDRELLERYVLWPDLRATWYRATIRKADPSEIESFLDEHGLLKPARELRYRYALQLARTGDLDGYLDIYQAYYQGLEIARLDCIALHAELGQDRDHSFVRIRLGLILLTNRRQHLQRSPTSVRRLLAAGLPDRRRLG